MPHATNKELSPSTQNEAKAGSPSDAANSPEVPDNKVLHEPPCEIDEMGFLEEERELRHHFLHISHYRAFGYTLNESALYKKAISRSDGDTDPINKTSVIRDEARRSIGVLVSPYMRSQLKYARLKDGTSCLMIAFAVENPYQRHESFPFTEPKTPRLRLVKKALKAKQNPKWYALL